MGKNLDDEPPPPIKNISTKSQTIPQKMDPGFCPGSYIFWKFCLLGFVFLGFVLWGFVHLPHGTSAEIRFSGNSEFFVGINES